MQDDLKQKSGNVLIGKKNKKFGPVRKYPNGTVDWGTPGNRPRSYPAEYYQSLKEIVEDQGFIFEEHDTVTDDGYILTVHRIRS